MTQNNRKRRIFIFDIYILGSRAGSRHSLFFCGFASKKRSSNNGSIPAAINP
jgi:hypothetical protein